MPDKYVRADDGAPVFDPTINRDNKTLTPSMQSGNVGGWPTNRAMATFRLKF